MGGRGDVLLRLAYLGDLALRSELVLGMFMGTAKVCASVVGITDSPMPPYGWLYGWW